MKTVEYVKLKSDTNYIPVKYAILEVTVGASLANSPIWLKCVSHGCDTEENLTAFKLTGEGYQAVPDANGNPVAQTEYAPVDKSGIIGIIGEYQISNLDAVEAYNRPSIKFTPNIELG